MLKKLTVAAMLLAPVFLSTPGYCYTITPLGLLTGQSMNDTRAYKHDNATSPIEDYYTFSVDKPVNISASVTNAFTRSNQYIDDFTIALFSGSPLLVSLASSDPIASGTDTVANNPPDSQFAKLKALRQAAGSYYLKVTGTTADSPSYSGSLAISITTVPLPASAPMFGAAILALGAVGYGLKRKKASASV